MTGVRSILHTIRSLALYNQAQCCLLDGCRTHGTKPMQRRGLCTSGATTRTRRAGRCSCASMRCWIGSTPTSGASCCCPKSSIVACKRRPQPPGSFRVGEVLLPLRGRVTYLRAGTTKGTHRSVASRLRRATRLSWPEARPLLCMSVRRL